MDLEQVMILLKGIGVASRSVRPGQKRTTFGRGSGVVVGWWVGLGRVGWFLGT